MEYNSWQSAEIGELVKAIAQAQAVMKPAIKDASNPFFKSKYADLSAVWSSLHPFSEQGIAITQSPMPSDQGTIVLDTQLSHSSGQWMRSRLILPVAKQDPQGYGSAITYARRYAIGCMCGIVTEEDDDGSAASHAPVRQPYKQDAKAKIAELKREAMTAGEQHPSRQPDSSTSAPEPTPMLEQQGHNAAAPPPSFMEQASAVTYWKAVIDDTNDLPGLQKHWETITKDPKLDSTQKIALFKVYQARVKAIGKPLRDKK